VVAGEAIPLHVAVMLPPAATLTEPAVNVAFPAGGAGGEERRAVPETHTWASRWAYVAPAFGSSTNK